MRNSARANGVVVSADGRGPVSQAGAVLLCETVRVTGLARGLSAGLARWRAPRAAHLEVSGDFVLRPGDSYSITVILSGTPATSCRPIEVDGALTNGKIINMPSAGTGTS